MQSSASNDVKEISPGKSPRRKGKDKYSTKGKSSGSTSKAAFDIEIQGYDTKFRSDETASFDYHAANDDISNIGVIGISDREKHNKTYKEKSALGDFYYVKQKHGFFSTAISIIQLLFLSIVMALCGVAPLEVNPTVGPYPDALSSAGAKNSYLIIREGQYWRLISPCFLHVGILHLLLNVAIQLESGAFFEREWGSTRWLFIYFISALGSTLLSCCFDPDDVTVGSSGPLMGLFGAKISEITSLTFFETVRLDRDYGDSFRKDQLGGILCSLSIVFVITFFPFVDWISQVGGFATGFFLGMIIFARYFQKWIWAILWGGSGLFVILFGFICCALIMTSEVIPDDDLGDVCIYFGYLHNENYDCNCFA